MASSGDEYASIFYNTFYSMYSVKVLLVGFQVFLCGYGLIAFRETKPSLRQGRAKYITISILILFLYMVSAVGDSYGFYLSTKSKDLPEVLAEHRQSVFTWWSIASGICTTMVTIIGDGLLVYRCYIVCRENTAAWVLTAILYAASIIISIAVNVLYATIGSTDVRSFRVFCAWAFSSVGVNCLVTALISYKLIRFRNEVLKHTPLFHSQISLGVVAILVESAVPLAICGIVAAGMGMKNHPTGAEASASTVFITLWFAFNAISPQLITLRVSLGRSWQHEGPQSSFLKSSAFGLEFAHGTGSVQDRRHAGSVTDFSVHDEEVEGDSQDI
ncbi:hypothetical protein CPB83DRAFT_852289 [Crepidotus variabilis]|uniref:Uncharacterized protein n=1 Tax=Crepidotus variabilis TaxID=179855 RepID=A0A9P6EI81_9AGAR|nr:hypothetical protein CPB83DRAFT_852289 [Crepidotus variabilis]